MQDKVIAARIPCEDVGLVVLDQSQIWLTHLVLSRLMTAGAAVITCGANHLPVGLMLPTASNHEMTGRQKIQVAVSRPLQKRLWQQIVREKIRNQASAICPHPDSGKLRNLIDEVNSGDKTNVEAHAARIYWPVMMGRSFRRLPAGPWPNPLLDYGYTILRAAVARAICSAGLNPAFGLHHANAKNPFCLADDLMEPFRPRVDQVAKSLVQAGATEITPDVKRQILSLVFETVETPEDSGPFFVQLHDFVANLWRCFTREQSRLVFPHWRTDGNL